MSSREATSCETPWNFQSVRERNKSMWNNSLLSDVEFSFLDTKSNKTVIIPAHSYVLAISSPVFFDMLTGDSRRQGTETFEITDCDPENFGTFLLYLYTDELTLRAQCLQSVLYLATKYRVTSLVEKCARFVEDNLSPSNVFAMLSCVEFLKDSKLEERCWEMVDFNASEAVKSSEFSKISGDLMSRFLQRDSLRIREVELLKAFSEWITLKSEEEENFRTDDRNACKHLVSWIRFPLMSQQEFAEFVPRTNLLSKEQIINMFLFFSSVSEVDPVFSQSPRAGTLKRCPLYPESREGFVYSGYRPEYLTCSVNSSLRLFGVRLYGNLGAKYSVQLEVYRQSDPTRLLSTKNGIYESDKEMKDGYCGYDVAFDKPLLLNKETPCTLKLLLQGPPSFYGYHGFSTVEYNGITFTFSREKDSVPSRFQAGQFAEILFFE